ncbi:hypothetical protein pb186bvf_006393 [Paramecium bursaria]
MAESKQELLLRSYQCLQIQQSLKSLSDTTQKLQYLVLKSQIQRNLIHQSHLINYDYYGMKIINQSNQQELIKKKRGYQERQSIILYAMRKMTDDKQLSILRFFISNFKNCNIFYAFIGSWQAEKNLNFTIKVKDRVFVQPHNIQMASTFHIIQFLNLNTERKKIKITEVKLINYLME